MSSYQASAGCPEALMEEMTDMDPMIASLFLVVAAAIMVILFGILTAVKRGFNQVILGLEALEKKLSDP